MERQPDSALLNAEALDGKRVLVVGGDPPQPEHAEQRQRDFQGAETWRESYDHDLPQGFHQLLDRPHAHQGVLLGKLVTMTPQEICNRYSDGLLAKYYSPAMIQDLFAQFPSITITGFSQLGGIYPLPTGWRQWLARLVPLTVTQWLKRTAGDFLFFDARK